MIEPIKLTRPQRRALAEKGVDFLKMISGISGDGKDPEDVTMNQLIKVIDLKHVDAIVDIAYPQYKSELDVMPEMDLIQLALQTYMKSFSGNEVAGKS